MNLTKKRTKNNTFHKTLHTPFLVLAKKIVINCCYCNTSTVHYYLR